MKQCGFWLKSNGQRSKIFHIKLHGIFASGTFETSYCMEENVCQLNKSLLICFKMSF